MKRLISIIAIMLSSAMLWNGSAQNDSGNNRYLQKAKELLEESGKETEAISQLTKQIELTPDNVEALFLRMRIYMQTSEYDKALRDINHAIKVNKPKHTGINNSTLYWWKGFIYINISDLPKAAQTLRTAYELAQKDDPQYVHSIAFDYADVLGDLKDTEDSDKIYNQMLAEDESNVGAIVGLGKNMMIRGEYDDAEKMVQRALKMRKNIPFAYYVLLQLYDMKGETAKSIDAAIEYVAITQNPQWKYLVNVGKKNPYYAAAKIHAKMKTSDRPEYWRELVIEINYSAGKYTDALKECEIQEKENGESIYLHYMKSLCYRNLGMPENAINELNRTLEEVGSKWLYLCDRGKCYRLTGNFDKAIDDFTAAIENNPSRAYPYYERGWCHELSGKDDLALEDYNLGISIDKDYPYIFLYRGLLLKKMGRTDEAIADFETVVAKDTVATDGSCTHFALHELGRDEEAIEWMDKIIAEQPTDAGNWYDKACLYARMARTDEALEYLEKAFSYGYRNFTHLEYDQDMDPLRDTEKYKALVAKYKAVHEEFIRRTEEGKQ